VSRFPIFVTDRQSVQSLANELPLRVDIRFFHGNGCDDLTSPTSVGHFDPSQVDSILYSLDTSPGC
jgi:hypothetical protein